MICLKNGRQAWGQKDRDLDAAAVVRARETRRVTWALAGAAYETQIARARPAPGSHRRATDYPTAVRAAIAAWDEEMK